MSSNGVHTGRWTRWADGRVMGSTVTLTSSDGDFLVAFLALFVSYVGSQLWGILRFLIHQWRANRRPADNFHRQQQAVLRNSTSPDAALWLWVNLAWTGRSQTRHPLLRSITVILIALANIAAFAVASIFSSNVTSTKNFVLLKGQQCGSWRWQAVEALSAAGDSANNPASTASLVPAWSAYYTDSVQASRESLSYGRNCYVDYENPFDCQNYITQKLPFTTRGDAECPFGEGLCADSSLEIDSDYLYSDTHLGLNTGGSDRVAYRRKMTCSVLGTDGYASSSVAPMLPSDTNSDGAYPYSNNTFFYYGPTYQQKMDGRVNYTQFYSNYSHSRATFGNDKDYDIS